LLCSAADGIGSDIRNLLGAASSFNRRAEPLSSNRRSIARAPPAATHRRLVQRRRRPPHLRRPPNLAIIFRPRRCRRRWLPRLREGGAVSTSASIAASLGAQPGADQGPAAWQGFPYVERSSPSSACELSSATPISTSAAALDLSGPRTSTLSRRGGHFRVHAVKPRARSETPILRVPLLARRRAGRRDISRSAAPARRPNRPGDPVPVLRRRQRDPRRHPASTSGLEARGHAECLGFLRSTDDFPHPPAPSSAPDSRRDCRYLDLITPALRSKARRAGATFERLEPVTARWRRAPAGEPRRLERVLPTASKSPSRLVRDGRASGGAAAQGRLPARKSHRRFVRLMLEEPARPRPGRPSTSTVPRPSLLRAASLDDADHRRGDPVPTSPAILRWRSPARRRVLVMAPLTRLVIPRRRAVRCPLLGLRQHRDPALLRAFPARTI